LALKVGWDEKLVAFELSDLKNLEFNRDLTGVGTLTKRKLESVAIGYAWILAGTAWDTAGIF